MSTNYYWRHNACECCGRYDELHICKSLSMFRGHFDPSDLSEDKPLLVSWAQWKQRLRSEPGRIVDEYGTEHDVPTFIADVDKVAPEQRRRQYDWVRRHHHHAASRDRIGRVGPGCDWLDADGFSFYGGEFS